MSRTRTSEPATGTFALALATGLGLALGLALVAGAALASGLGGALTDGGGVVGGGGGGGVAGGGADAGALTISEAEGVTELDVGGGGSCANEVPVKASNAHATRTANTTFERW